MSADRDFGEWSPPEETPWELSGELVEWWWGQAASDRARADAALVLAVLDGSATPPGPSGDGFDELTLDDSTDAGMPRTSEGEAVHRAFLAFDARQPRWVLDNAPDPAGLPRRTQAAVYAVLVLAHAARERATRYAFGLVGPESEEGGQDPLLSDLQHGSGEELRRVMGQRIRIAREAAGLSRAEVSSALGKSRQWLAKLESGDSTAQPNLLAWLANRTGRSAGWFFGDFGTSGRTGYLDDLKRLRGTIEELEGRISAALTQGDGRHTKDN